MAAGRGRSLKAVFLTGEDLLIDLTFGGGALLVDDVQSVIERTLVNQSRDNI